MKQSGDKKFKDGMPSKRFSFTPESMPYGRVLVVDDVDANLYVTKGLLAFYDLQVETCGSGYDAIDKVKQGKIYDVVFMDEIMTSINGTAAMLTMRGMGYSQPIVVFSANILTDQAKEYIKGGFDDFMSKPIQTRQLNAILHKYIKDKHPLEVLKAAKKATDKHESTIKGDIHNYQSNTELVNKLKRKFVRHHKNAFLELNEAMNSGNTDTAHIVAHTLKSVAGLIHEFSLVQAAEHVDSMLKDGKVPTENQLSVLENELNRVLDDIGKPEIMPLNGATAFDKEKSIALLNKLEPLLLLRNVECMKLIDELRTMPETVVLCRQIEDFDYKDALKTLSVLKEILEEV